MKLATNAIDVSMHWGSLWSLQEGCKFSFCAWLLSGVVFSWERMLQSGCHFKFQIWFFSSAFSYLTNYLACMMEYLVPGSLMTELEVFTCSSLLRNEFLHLLSCKTTPWRLVSLHSPHSEDHLIWLCLFISTSAYLRGGIQLVLSEVMKKPLEVLVTCKLSAIHESSFLSLA